MFEIIEGKANIESALPNAISAYKAGKKEIGVIVASILVHASTCGDASMLSTVTAVLTKRDNSHLIKFLSAFTPIKVAEGKVTAKGWAKPENWNLEVIRSSFMDWDAGKAEATLRKPTKIVDSLIKGFEKWDSDSDQDELAALEMAMAVAMLEKFVAQRTNPVPVVGTVGKDGEIVPTNGENAGAATAVH